MVNISWQVDAFPSWRADCPDREGRTPEPSSRVTHVDAAATASGLGKQQRTSRQSTNDPAPFELSEFRIHWGQQQVVKDQCLSNSLRIQGFLPELRMSGTPNHQHLAGESRKEKKSTTQSPTEESSRPVLRKRPASSAVRVQPPWPSALRLSQWRGSTSIRSPGPA